jgi:hypothetical protein
VLYNNKQYLGINYSNTFISVIQLNIFKLLIALVTIYNLKYKYLDIITAFFNRKLNCKNIYI